ncbi:putative Gamma-glutamyl hydrolase A [Paratrimastix pyriformis]|uniref:folate gamma-glutamyl hydrolase n=1 Tax=Paratrimastix pyriformis TaxID=342808 RepID=A0ABQ8UBF3_9EUKA|nr:putative Gamma-glutamyl hydrolase A [Paratrimastix pyriformis]
MRPFFSVLVALVLVQAALALNLRPVIGILAKPASDDPTPQTSVISASYVKWLEAGGARILVIPYDATHDRLDSIFSQINGIFFTGGGLSLDVGTTYWETANYLFQKAIQATNNGDYFPLFGTCMGFQLLNILASTNHSILSFGFDSYNLPLPLEFTPETATSRMLGKATTPADVLTTLSTKPVTINWHHYGITPDDFYNDRVLPGFYRVLATNADTQGRRFISMVEGRKYPVYGLQWHAERNQYEWGTGEKLDHSVEAVRAVEWVVNYFVQDCRQSGHQLGADLEKTLLIYNFAPTYSDGSLTYSFPASL